MSLRYWNPNAISTTMVVTFTVTGVANGATLNIICNGKTITYTCTGTDSTSTAAANLEALLLPAANAPVEFADATWSVSGNVITATAATQGTPFTFTSSVTGGALMTQATAVANSSPSDVDNPNNWLTSAGATGLPVNGDDIIFADTSVSALCNLSSLTAINLNSITLWNTFTGNIGLPEINTAGYIEYRPTYFQIGCTNYTQGFGSAGQGSGLVRVNVGAGA
jgi:hypothetical protein